MNPEIIIALFLLALTICFQILARTRKGTTGLPPGSLGLPIIGQSLSYLRARRANKAEEWLQERARNYGPISKLSILGIPTVFVHGQAANKFIYTCNDNILSNQQPPSMRRIIGEKNIMELTGEDHKRIRGALVSFLKPEVLKQYVGKMEEEIRKHSEMHWIGKQQVLAMPLMKTLTFNVMISLIFGLEHGEKRDKLINLCQESLAGVLSVPINLPFTRYNRSLRASAKLRDIIMDLIKEKRSALSQQAASPQQDLISCLVSLQNGDNSIALTDEEIASNIILVMIAGHDTTSNLLTFLIRLLASDPSIYAAIAQEQDEIVKSKVLGELLTWEDLAKMKYTWRVAMEILRITPPVFASYRRVLQDFEYEGYLIPKGWQVFWASCMTHLDEKIYPEPSKFDPSRFEKQAPPFCFIPFGGGPRMCPGNEFARIEALVTIHYLVTHYTWKLSSKDNPFSRDPAPVFKNGLAIQIIPKSCVLIS